MSEAKPVTITSTVILKAVLAVVNRGADKGERHSFEYWLEECIVAGATAKMRSWDYSEETKNAKAFTKEVAQLSPLAKDFTEQYQKLASKYGIGGTQVNLS